MKKRIYNTPLTCADLLMVGMGQIMVDSTSDFKDPQKAKPKFSNKLGQQYI